jgi:N6-adenosine-specific RNA methylase IME4
MARIGRPPIRKKGAYTAAERMRRYRARLKRKNPSPKILAKQQRRADRELALAEATRRAAESLGRKLAGVIIADPPWDMQVRDRVSGMDRHVANHYPVMSLDDLAVLRLPAAENCVLYPWSPVAQLANAVRLIEGWGFEYKSAHIWTKPDIALGYWGRENAELLLIATRGDVPAPALGQQWPYAIAAPRGELSAKPAVFFEMIERLFPNTPKLEMFARRTRPGWDS